MKKIFVSVDMEGIGGIVSPNQVGIRENALYEEARRLMAEEVNAVIAGVNEGGGFAVIGDSHGSMLNIPIEMLRGDFLLACGEDKILSMMAAIDETFHGVIFHGYHSRFGTPYSVMDHTYSPSTLYSLKINGKEVGEAEINAEVAGYFNVPVIMASGDDTTIEQIKKSFPCIETVVVKKALGRFSALCEPVDKVRKRLKEAAKRVTTDIERYSCLYKSIPPIIMEYTWNTAAMAERAAFVPGVLKKSERVTVYEADDYITAFKVFVVLRILAKSASNSWYL